MQSITDLQNTLTELQSMVLNTINPIFTDLQNSSHVFDPVISSHNAVITKIDEMVTYLNNLVIDVIQGATGATGLQGLKGDAGSIGLQGIQGIQGINAPLGLLYEYTVTGANVTTISIPNLDIITHNDYKIELDLKNSTATASTIKLYANGDFTPANYVSQTLYSSATTTTSSSTADAVIGVCDISSRCLINANLSLSSDGYFRWSSMCSRGTMTLPTLSQSGGIKKAVLANLTSLTITASVASSIAVGSVVRIFRGDA